MPHLFPVGVEMEFDTVLVEPFPEPRFLPGLVLPHMCRKFYHLALVIDYFSFEIDGVTRAVFAEPGDRLGRQKLLDHHIDSLGAERTGGQLLSFRPGALEMRFERTLPRY